MASTPADRMARTLQRAIKNDDRSLYAIAKAAGLHYSIPDRFLHGDRVNIALSSVAALADVVGLELRPRKGG